ncbi:hypothetical protein ABFJ38_005131 [Citrobacter freundii]
MTVYEMEGFLRGKCLPGDMKVNESNAQYLVRKFSELQSQNAELAVQLANAESKCRELAAECKTLSRFISGSCYVFDGDHDDDMPDEFVDASHYMPIVTPATDAFLAEVRAQARNEGINYAAGRLAAAFNHGFVDKPLTEVCDVVRMIMDTKEELANSTLPAADGISGEYAEKFLEEFAAQIRKGVQS